MNTIEQTAECTDLESRASIASLEVLHTLRRTLVAQNAGLMARYGNFGLADDFRKRMLECAKVRIALKYADTVKKPAETAVAAEAYASDEYGKFLDNALDEKIQYLNVQNEIQELDERIRDRELSLLAYNSELKLAK